MQYFSKLQKLGILTEKTIKMHFNRMAFTGNKSLYDLCMRL